MDDLLRKLGVPAEVIVREDRSTSTWENIAFAAPILARHRVGQVWLVTDLYHLPRARLTAWGFGLRARGHAPPLKGARPSVFARGLLREGPACLYYLYRVVRHRWSRPG